MAEPLILFAHGAGVGSESRWMKGWTKRLAPLGRVIPFDYPYMAAGRRKPDELVVLLEAHLDALEQAREGHEGPVVLVGKSLGARVGCHLSLEEPIDALVCLGYPLSGRRGRVVDDVLTQVTAPVLFVQGTRDPLCDLRSLAAVRASMPGPSQVFEVVGGDHSLVLGEAELAKRSITQKQADRLALKAIRAFLQEHLGS